MWIFKLHAKLARALEPGRKSNMSKIFDLALSHPTLSAVITSTIVGVTIPLAIVVSPWWWACPALVIIFGMAGDAYEQRNRKLRP